MSSLHRPYTAKEISYLGKPFLFGNYGGFRVGRRRLLGLSLNRLFDETADIAGTSQKIEFMAGVL
jgi:hypothetical protein